jgi:hypothetical protein
MDKRTYGIMTGQSRHYDRTHKTLAVLYFVALVAATGVLAYAVNSVLHEVTDTVRSAVHSLEMARGGSGSGGHGHGHHRGETGIG